MFFLGSKSEMDNEKMKEVKLTSVQTLSGSIFLERLGCLFNAN